MGNFKFNDVVTYSKDRCYTIAGNASLVKRRVDLKEKWKDICEDDEGEVWEGILDDGMLCLLQVMEGNEADMQIQPDFDNDLNNEIE